jgi:hypothetical protein
MLHGLMLGMWMTAASLVGVWLWRTGAVRRILQIPMAVLVLPLLATTLLCKSTGAMLLLAGGLIVLEAGRILRTNLVVYAVVLSVPLYMAARAKGWWHGEQLLDLAAMVDEDRAESYRFRLENEDLLLERALQKPLWGWGGWGRWRVQDEWGKDVSTSDGLWVIALGETGLVGLAAVTGATLLPVILFIRRIPVRRWARPESAAGAALAMLLVLHALDNLPNAMPNSIFYLVAGGLGGFSVTAARDRIPFARRRIATPAPLAGRTTTET